MSAPKILLLIGAGANVGASIVRKFASNGYKVALGSRSTTPGLTPEGYLGIKVDASKPDSVAAAYEAVKKEFGTPTVVINNAYGARMGVDDPLGVSVEDFSADLSTNVTSSFVLAKLAASQEALSELEAANTKLTFIHTGNLFNSHVFPKMLTLALGKAGAAYLIEALAKSHGPKGLARFYYADQRHEDGQPFWTGLDGDAHGEFFYELVQGTEQGQAPVTFVKGKGAVEFGKIPGF